MEPARLTLGITTREESEASVSEVVSAETKMPSPQVGEVPQAEVNTNIGPFREDSEDGASEFQGFLDDEDAADENIAQDEDEGFAEGGDGDFVEGGAEGFVDDEGLDDQETSGNTGGASTSAPSVTDGEVNSNAQAEVEAQIVATAANTGGADNDSTRAKRPSSLSRQPPLRRPWWSACKIPARPPVRTGRSSPSLSVRHTSRWGSCEMAVVFLWLTTHSSSIVESQNSRKTGHGDR